MNIAVLLQGAYPPKQNLRWKFCEISSLQRAPTQCWVFGGAIVNGKSHSESKKKDEEVNDKAEKKEAACKKSSKAAF